MSQISSPVFDIFFKHFSTLLNDSVLQDLRHHFGCRNKKFANFAVYIYARNLTDPVAQALSLSKKEPTRFHFTKKRIEAHVCICFVAYKCYKELERILKISNIKQAVDKVLSIAKTITTIKVKLQESKETITKTMILTDRHKSIARKKPATRKKQVHPERKTN